MPINLLSSRLLSKIYCKCILVIYLAVFYCLLGLLLVILVMAVAGTMSFCAGFIAVLKLRYKCLVVFIESWL